MPQKGCTLHVDNTLPWDLAATAGSVPAGLSLERGLKKVLHSEVCDISSTEKIDNTFFSNVIFFLADFSLFGRL